jgi:hypothetical protein
MAAAPKSDTLAKIPAGAVAAVEDYFYGSYEADRARMERGFHPDAHIVGFLGAKYVDEAAPDFIARLAGAPSDKAQGFPFHRRIVEARVKDNLAFFVAEVEAHGKAFTDFITVMLIDGRWRIRHKSYTTPTWP